MPCLETSFSRKMHLIDSCIVIKYWSKTSLFVCYILCVDYWSENLNENSCFLEQVKIFFIPCYSRVARYYVVPCMCLSVCTSVNLSALCFHSLTWKSFWWIFSKLCLDIDVRRECCGILNGQITFSLSRVDIKISFLFSILTINWLSQLWYFIHILIMTRSR